VAKKTKTNKKTTKGSHREEPMKLVLLKTLYLADIRKRMNNQIPVYETKQY